MMLGQSKQNAMADYNDSERDATASANTCHRAWVVILVLSVLFMTPVTSGQTAHSSRFTPVQLAANSEEDTYYDQLVRKIEPDGVGHRERLGLYLAFFRREMINDPRLFAWHITVTVTGMRHVRLGGFVEFKETHVALIEFLKRLGFTSLEDRIETLPSSDLGDNRFAFVTSTHSLARERPGADEEVVTDCLLGEPLCVLKKAENGFLLCHTGEGYVGYVLANDVYRVNSRQFQQYQAGPMVVLTGDYQMEDGRRLPAGARIKYLKKIERELRVELPGGQQATLPQSSCCLYDGRSNQRVQRVIQGARRLLGTPYLWGGKTSIGTDCSGLIQTAFAAEGIYLPRDASQQIYLGRLTGTRWYRAGMRAGDTLYFLGSRGKIRHTALYLGEGQYIEAVRKVVRITSFRPEDPNYDQLRSQSFVFAKRLFE